MSTPSVLQSLLPSVNVFLEREESIVLLLSDDECVAGLSGEDRPRLSLPLVLRRSPDGFMEETVTEAAPAHVLDEALEPFMRRLSFSLLQANVHERKAVVCFPVTASEGLRGAVCRVLFKLRCPGIVVATSSVACLLPLGLRTALVVEQGGGEVRFVPVLEGALAAGAMTFARSDDSEEELAKAAARAVASSPLDTRLGLVSHVVACGVAGDRAAQWLRSALPEGLKTHVAIVASPFGGQSLAWLGSSILGSTLHKKHAPVTVLRKAEDLTQLGQLS